MGDEKEYTVNGLPLPKRSTRRKIVYGTLIYCALVIVGILAFGTPGNTLHESGLAWAFATFIGVVFAYVFGAVFDNWTVWRKDK